MTTLGEIFRRYGPAYREKLGARLPASQRAAMAAIEQCRTEALGGHVYTCPALCHDALQLSLVSQSPLPDLPAWPGADLARQATGACCFPCPTSW